MYGQIKSTVQCLTCEHISLAFDPYLMLSVPIVRDITLKFQYISLARLDENGEPIKIESIIVRPKSTWTFRDVISDLKNTLNLPADSDLVMAEMKNCVIERIWSDS